MKKVMMITNVEKCMYEDINPISNNLKRGKLLFNEPKKFYKQEMEHTIIKWDVSLSSLVSFLYHFYNKLLYFFNHKFLRTMV